MADTVSAKRAVVISLLGSGIIVGADRIRSGKFPEPQIFGGLIFAYIVLSFFAETVPEVAQPFALLIFTGVLLGIGPDVWGSIAKAVKPK